MSIGNAYAVILAGGGGTRLWPASRRSRPKQLLKLGGNESLLQAAVRRVIDAGFHRDRTLIVTAADQEGQVRAAVPELPATNVLAEPGARNTAGAVALAAAFVLRVSQRPDAVLAILPSDPHIGNESRFAKALRIAVSHASEAIVTIGIRPTRPETGFGYLRLGKPVGDGRDGVREVAQFVEKPDSATARRYVASKDYLWNSGMFFLTAGRMLEEAHKSLPALGNFTYASTQASAFQPFVAENYGKVEAISIDHGIMEKASGIRVVPGNFGWNDVGSWSALGKFRTRDGGGNVLSGDVVACDTKGCIVVSESPNQLVGVVGIKNLVVVATDDAILVVPKNRAQDVRAIVEELKKTGRTKLL